MPRIPYADIASRPPHIRKMVESSPINLTRMIAHATPEVLDGFSAFAGAFYLASSLPVDLREIAILRAGYLAGAAYETSHHESISRSIGMSDAQIAAIREGGRHEGVLSEAQQAVLDFSDEFIIDARVSDAALAAVRKHLTDEQLMDMMFVTGAYMTVSRIMEITGLPLDETPLDAQGLQNTVKAARGQ